MSESGCWVLLSINPAGVTSAPRRRSWTPLTAELVVRRNRKRGSRKRAGGGSQELCLLRVSDAAPDSRRKT